MNSGSSFTASQLKMSPMDKPLSRGKGEVSLSAYALLFSEIVQYCQNRVYTVPELQERYVQKFGVLFADFSN
jgi:trafficking protein particle complex subunit 5